MIFTYLRRPHNTGDTSILAYKDTIINATTQVITDIFSLGGKPTLMHRLQHGQLLILYKNLLLN